MPAHLGRWFFSASLGLLMCIGGAVAYWLAAPRAIDALAIGFFAPAIISGLLADKHGENPFIKRLPPARLG